MTDAKIRWRTRCERAVATGHGLPWRWRRRRHFGPGVAAALQAAGSLTRPEFAHALVDLKLMFSRFSLGNEHHGLRLALTWLREEIEQGE